MSIIHTYGDYIVKSFSEIYILFCSQKMQVKLARAKKYFSEKCYDFSLYISRQNFFSAGLSAN